MYMYPKEMDEIQNYFNVFHDERVTASDDLFFRRDAESRQYRLCAR